MEDGDGGDPTGQTDTRTLSRHRNLFVQRLNALPAFLHGAGHLRTGVINVDVVSDQTCSRQQNNRNATMTCSDALAWVGVRYA